MSRNCCFVLNAHVPWVRDVDTPHSMEEDWLHSAILETHLPLLEMLFRLREEGVPFHLTLNLSPTLLAMLQDRILRRRTLNYIDRTLRLCRDEVERGDVTGFRDLATDYEDRIFRLRSLYVETWQGDLIKAYSDLRDSGHLEFTASAATHGILPLLMRVPEAGQAQVRVGIRQYVQSFGRMPKGFWLPECAYAPAVSNLLRREGIEWTAVEEHGMKAASGADERFPYIVGKHEDGLHIFGRDSGSSSEIWSADEGFPGDGRYRNFMRDIGFDAPIEYLREYLGDSEERRLTGLKYHRLQREGDDNLLYDPELASRAVEEHSLRFVSSRGAQLAGLEADGIENPLVVCAFDMDLFGHWWFEGTEFLEKMFRITAERGDFRFVNPVEFLKETESEERPEADPAASSWSEGGYFESWTSPENNWLQAEVQNRADMLARFTGMFDQNRADYDEEGTAHYQRCIQLMVRELLLAQSSDWGFLMRVEPSREYAEKRAREHLADFDRIREILTSGDDGRLDEIAEKHPVFPDLPWNLFEAYE